MGRTWSTRAPGMATARVGSTPGTMRATCTSTRPPEARAAIACRRLARGHSLTRHSHRQRSHHHKQSDLVSGSRRVGCQCVRGTHLEYVIIHSRITNSATLSARSISMTVLDSMTRELVELCPPQRAPEQATLPQPQGARLVSWFSGCQTLDPTPGHAPCSVAAKPSNPAPGRAPGPAGSVAAARAPS